MHWRNATSSKSKITEGWAHMSRTEHDLIGDRDVPDDAYWGVHTLRAVENFPISGHKIGACAELVDALAAVKEACAAANRELGLLAPELAAAIISAAQKSATARCTTSSSWI
ncbi:lyase family protein [Paracoccus cavernae]